MGKPIKAEERTPQEHINMLPYRRGAPECAAADAEGQAPPKCHRGDGVRRGVSARATAHP